MTTSSQMKHANIGNLERFISDTRDCLVRYCRTLTRSEWDAEDVAQEAIARVFPRISDGSVPLSAAQAYVFAAARNVWTDICRRRLTERTVAEKRELDDGAPVALDEDHFREAMRVILGCLEPREQATVLLADMLGFPLDEVALLLGIEYRTVKTMAWRARRKLRQMPTQVGEEYLSHVTGAFRSGDARALVAVVLRGKCGVTGLDLVTCVPVEETTVRANSALLSRCSATKRPYDLVWVRGRIRDLPGGVKLA